MGARFQQKFDHFLFEMSFLLLSSGVDFAQNLNIHFCKHVSEITLLCGVGTMLDARNLHGPRPVALNLTYKRSCVMELT